MMPDYQLTQILLKKNNMKTILIKISIMLLSLPPSIAIAPVVSLEEVVKILIWLFIVDFATGIGASYFEWKKTAPDGKWFFGQSQGFSSDKFKKCFIKGMVYAGFPLVVQKFQHVFLLKNISFTSVTAAEMDIATICILLFCANELFSIFWENLPKCGLNFPKLIRNFFTGIKTVKNDINDITD